MTVSELNDYIKHYLEEDKTHTAIMLTGEWGSGKTYYIEKVLTPFLQEDNKRNRSIVISLYGLENISDISKSIYMELRMKALEKDSEAIATTKLIAKTIVKGAAGRFGIEVNMSEDDLQKLYSSVDLSEKLLVLEDLERSNIELIKLLGYVNNLVERDGVKVLLVANENEILNKESKTSDSDFTSLFPTPLKNNDKEDDKGSVSTDIQRYLRIKEKTISDTIYFESDYCEAVRNIVNAFNSKKLKEIVEEDAGVVEKLSLMVKRYCHKNFRTFIFATQKTVDIFDKMKESYDKDFLKCIYFGMISFSAKIKKEDFPEWQGTEHLSTILGTNKNPLFRFCYDYLRWQKIDIENIPEAKSAYDEMKLYDRNSERSDEDLQKLYSYYERTEIEVRDALKSIEERLTNPEDIAFYNYGKLAAYLITISHTIGFDYTQCKKRMIQNIREKGDRINSRLLFLPQYDFEGEEKQELEDFFNQLSESMNTRKSQNDFSYYPDEIENLYSHVIKEEQKIRINHEFICKYNATQLVEMLFHASSKQISDFRGTLLTIYRYADKGEFIEADIHTMRELLELIQEKLNSQDYDIDKIQMKQLNWLCINLKTFISQMS